MSLIRVQDVSVNDIYKRKKPRKHYVYFIHVQWQDGPITPVYRSYNTLLELQERLLRIKEFLQKQNEDENSAATLLKGKKISDRFTIRKRAKALRRMSAVEQFLKAVVHLPPHISESDPVINFFHPLVEDLVELDYDQKEIYYSLENWRRGSKHKHIHHISEPILVEQYVAIADYVKREDNDISLKAGNVVDVIEKNEHGWWFVDLDGEVGWAPASYLEPRDGSMDDQVLEVFEEGKEETYITMTAYKPELQDEIQFEMGQIVKVIQKNVDGWWLVKKEEKEGWAPSMLLREIATSQPHAREKGKHTVRAMLRDNLHYTISGITGRRQTWNPPKRKKSVKRTIPMNGNNQTNSGLLTNANYINLEFHEARKRREGGQGRTRQKLDPSEVQGGTTLPSTNGMTENTENANKAPTSDGFLQPRALSSVEEETPETVSRGTSPIPSPILRQNSSESSTSSHCDVFRPISLSECQGDETGAKNRVQNNKTERNSVLEDDALDSPLDSKEKDINETSVDDDENKEGEQYTENMPELIKRRYYALGAYEKQDEEEVDLRENAEVEVIRESNGGWWLVRTSSHSIGWAPSNYLEKIAVDTTDGEVTGLSDKTEILEVIPIRPPKSARVRKMTRDMCIEREFWHYIQKGKDTETCLLEEPDISPDVSHSEAETGKNQSPLERNPYDVEVMAFTFDDYECDSITGICRRKSRKTQGIKHVAPNSDPTQEGPKNNLDINQNVLERSESVPSLAELESLGDDDDVDDDDDDDEHYYEELE